MFLEKNNLNNVVFDKIRLGCVAVIEKDGLIENYLVLPAGSGLRLEFEDEIITCVTPTSPIGKLMLGKGTKETFNIMIMRVNKQVLIKEIF